MLNNVGELTQGLKVVTHNLKSNFNIIGSLTTSLTPAHSTPKAVSTSSLSIRKDLQCK